MKQAVAGSPVISIENAASRLGVPADDVLFLGACGVLEKRKEGVSAASFARFVAEVSEALAGSGEPLAEGVQRAVQALRTEWDRALVERGPERPRRIFGAVPLGEHPDGTVVYAVEEALDRIVSRNLQVLGGGRVRQLLVDRALLEQWGVETAAVPDLLDAIAPELLARVPAELARQRRILPVELRGDLLVVATAAPLTANELDELRPALGSSVDFVIVAQAALDAAIARHYGSERKKIGEILVGMGFVTPDEVDAALEEQQRSPGARKLGALLVDAKACDGEHVAKALAHQAKLKYAQLDRFEIPPEVIELVPKEVAAKDRIVPLKMGKRALIVAVASPLGFIELDDLRFRLGHDVECVIASDDGITTALGRYYGAVDVDELTAKMCDLTAGSISVRREDLESLECIDDRPSPPPAAAAKRPRLELPEPETAEIPYEMVPPPAPPPPPPPGGSPAYASFEDTKAQLQIDEEELKKLVSQGELRGYRDGLSMKFKAEDVSNLRDGRETEPTIVLADSNAALSITESSDELLLEDSSTDTVMRIADIMGGPVRGAPSDPGSIAFDTTEEQYTISPHDSDPFAAASDDALETEAFEMFDEEGDGSVDAFRRAGAKSALARPSDSGAVPTIEPLLFAADVVERPAPATVAPPMNRAPAGMPAPAKPVNVPPPSARPIGAPMPYLSRSMAPPPAPMQPQMMPAAKKAGGLFGAVAGAASGMADALASGAGAVAKMRQEAPKTEAPKADDEPETFERKATVRYYSQMYARQNYPLLVVVSKRSIQKIVKQHVAQVEGKKSFKIRRGNPFVTVRPILPGCLCVPQEITLDVKPKVAEAKFWVTPTAEGLLEEARVEVLYEGKVVSTIEVPTRVTTQALAKLTGSAAFLTTTAGPFFEAFGISVKKESASFLADVLAHLAGGSFRYGIAGVFAFFALAFFLKRRPKAGPETEGFFDWGVEDVVEGEPLVRAVKAKLLVVGPEGRETVDLIHGTTLVGSAATAHVRVKGARSLADVACELRYDDAFFLRARGPGVKLNGEDLREGEERKLGRDAVVDLDSGRVTLWLLDLRQDPALDERRDEILESLVRARPSFERELRALWKRSASEPVRGALLEAMRDTFADPHGWQRVRESLRI